MAESSGGSKKLLWIMIILVVLSSGGAAAAIYMVMNQSDNEGNAGAAQEVTQQRQSPIFVEIEPFTVNLADERASRLLYTGITLRVGNEDTKMILEEHMPQVRSRLIMALSAMQAGELTSSEGKDQLSARIINRLSVPLTENQPPLDLREVLFTEFIVQ